MSTDLGLLKAGWVTAVATAVLAILTVILTLIAWRQLGAIAKTASADFLLKLKRDVYTKEARHVIHLLDNNWLSFKTIENDAYFKINEEKVAKSQLDDSTKRELRAKQGYSTYELDDLLLGHFEDLGLLEEKSILELEMVWEEFSTYIEIVWENREIQEYIKWARKTDPTVYRKFQRLYDKCKNWKARQ